MDLYRNIITVKYMKEEIPAYIIDEENVIGYVRWKSNRRYKYLCRFRNVNEEIDCTTRSICRYYYEVDSLRVPS